MVNYYRPDRFSPGRMVMAVNGDYVHRASYEELEAVNTKLREEIEDLRETIETLKRKKRK